MTNIFKIDGTTGSKNDWSLSTDYCAYFSKIRSHETRFSTVNIKKQISAALKCRPQPCKVMRHINQCGTELDDPSLMLLYERHYYLPAARGQLKPHQPTSFSFS